jgi:hypothetical protein
MAPPPLNYRRDARIETERVLLSSGFPGFWSTICRKNPESETPGVTDIAGYTMEAV